MKTINRLLILVCFIASVTACKKTENNPELSARVVGDYTLTYVKENGQLYKPNSSTKGTMKVIAESHTSVQLTIDVTNGNAANDLKGTVKGLILKDIGNGEVEMSKDGSVLGKGGNKQLTLKVAPTGGTPYELIGAK